MSRRTASPLRRPPASHGTGRPAPRILLSLARKTAHEHGVDLRTITGTGTGGRIVRADVEAAIAARPAARAPAGTVGLPVTRRRSLLRRPVTTSGCRCPRSDGSRRNG